MVRLLDVVNKLNANVLCGETRLAEKVESAFASDLMSDVLTLDTENMLLITGLVNLQVIRTLEMSDVSFVVFVRGKKVSSDMLELARENNIVVMECKQSMFKTCGLLFDLGISPVY